MSHNSANELVSDDFVITPDFTADEYGKTWSHRLCMLQNKNERDKACNKLYKYIWNLLFGPGSNEETQARAIALVMVQRPDASFLNPLAYNDWIRTVKDEIIKRGMSDFWQKEFVPKRLGLIWARDSDYFDDMDDPVPAQFYKIKDTDPTIVWKD